MSKEKFEELRQQSVKGDAGAQYTLGCMFALGQGIDKDEQEAVAQYRLAAAQNHVGAQYNLGAMLANGQGIAKDEQEAVAQFRLAAAQKHAGAQYVLGLMLAKGQGIAKDEQEAVVQFRLAAAQNHVDAQYNLGVMLANGHGVDKDEQGAVVQFRLAAAQGGEDAQFALDTILKDVLKKKIDLILNELKGKIGTIEQHISPKAHVKASELLKALQNSRDELITNMKKPNVDLKTANATFTQQCRDAINDALPLLENDLSLGDYLLNLLRRLVNAVGRIGFRSNFFELTVSKSQEAVTHALTGINTTDSDDLGPSI